jgi:DNA-binding response OmpR family regulator
LRILVADDDPDVVLTLTAVLRDEGHEVHGVHSGRQVLGALIDFDPDVVILDINLPERSGWDLAREIRARKGSERPTMIGISGRYRDAADRILSEILGFDHYFVKPYSPVELVKTIGSAQRK